MIIINETRLRNFALSCAEQRAHRFERVSKEFIERMDARLKAMVADEIKRLPSKGKTIR